ncbi:DEAD/DEAH box helicase [Streptomyces sp. NPDC090088]|uniref:DEAD/DEAH box helicase n=1 Tax=Streptomyces sp. NPDC090088 TaxID=3365944 RepID=UPI003817151B
MSEIWVRSPREWQQAAFEEYTSRLPQTYLAAVCPGGGKTEYALAVAKHLIQQGLINFVIVVSPTEALTRQWADKATQFGIALNPDMQGDQPRNQSREFVGGSVTYGLLAAKKNAFAFSQAMQIRQTLVILDEAHHTGENKAWGVAVQTAFELARYRLLLTGTPTRSDMDRIPFARYRQDADGVRRIVRDYDYGTGRGVRDQVIRSLDFRFYDAKVNELPFGDTVPMSANISEAVTRSDHSKFMGVVMDPESGWFSDLLPAVHKELTAIRRTVPNAGCLILANDKDHVHAYARLIKEITGHTPAVVISEKPDASETLEAFTDSDEPYIIAIRMVSEGVDIPRLRVLVWLTRTKTELFFAQGTARVVRIPDRADSGPAVVFMPSLDPLRELAQGIDKDIVHEITELEQQVAAYEAEQLELLAQNTDGNGAHPPPTQRGAHPEEATQCMDESGQLGFSSFSVEDVELERTFLGSEPHAVEYHHYAQYIIDEDGMAQTDVAVVRRLIARGRIPAPGPTRDPHEPPQQSQAAAQARALFRIRKEYQDKLHKICQYIGRVHFQDDFKMVRGRVNRETQANADWATLSQTKDGITFAADWAKSLDAGGPR